MISQEGQTRVYENKDVLPGAFFVEGIKTVKSKQEAIETMFTQGFDFRKTAVIEDVGGVNNRALKCESCRVEILDYSENKVTLKTENQSTGFLVLTDIDYPTWKARIDNQETKIYLTDYAFRGIIVPKGKHLIEFYVNLF